MRHLATVRCCGSDGAFESVSEQSSVRQAGQRIVQRQPLVLVRLFAQPTLAR